MLVFFDRFSTFAALRRPKPSLLPNCLYRFSLCSLLSRCTRWQKNLMRLPWGRSHVAGESIAPAPSNSAARTKKTKRLIAGGLGYQARWIGYWSKPASLVMTGMFSTWDCAMSSLSNGSRWWRGRSWTRLRCSMLMCNRWNRFVLSCSSMKIGNGSCNMSPLPRFAFIANSQMLAILKYIVVLASDIRFLATTLKSL